MHLIYFDEVKNNNTSQKYFWLGGIAVPSEKVKEIEAKVAEISEKQFGTPCLSSNTEFHAAELFHRKKNFKHESDISTRVELMGSLLRILDDNDIKKIFVQVDQAYFKNRFSLASKEIDELAFMFFCEKANALMKQMSDIGMIIGDRESDSLASKYAEHLSGWKNYSTEYQLGREINHLIDTVHFTHSHLSRLLQLADIHIWCRQFRALNRKPEKHASKLMLEEIGKCGKALFPSKYKQYPLGC